MANSNFTGMWDRRCSVCTCIHDFDPEEAACANVAKQYAPVLFSQAGLSSTTSAFLASGISGLLNIVCTIITQIFTDKWGRRSSMINGGLVISGTMIAIGSLYASQASTTTAGKWTIIALIYVFVVAYATSWAVVNRIYCSEIQPMHTRAAATSLGQCANWVSQ